MATQFQINLIGYSWSGHRCAYSYNAREIPANLDAVKRIAGDFESVEDYRVVSVTHGGDWTNEWTKREVLKDWHNEYSHDEYGELRGEG